MIYGTFQVNHGDWMGILGDSWGFSAPLGGDSRQFDKRAKIRKR